MKCLECKNEITGHKRKFCSRLCSGRNIQKRHRLTINANARQRLIDNPIEERRKRAENARKWRASHPESSRAISRGIKNTGNMPAPDDVIFYGYKEPLRKFDGGFGYMGVLSYSKEKDKVQCHICGRMFRAINNGHLGKVHKTTALEYKLRVGLSPTASLVGEGTRKKLFERPVNPNRIEELKKVHKKRNAHIKKTGNDPQIHRKLSLEVKNKRGTCPDQLLDKIDKTIKSFGRVPTEEEFKNFHHGKFLGSIRNTYGTWNKALAKLGHKSYSPRYTREDLLEAMRNFFQVHKRTPRWSDMERGLLPSSTSYYNQFKSLNQARQEAKVPVLIPVGRHHEESMNY